MRLSNRFRVRIASYSVIVLASILVLFQFGGIVGATGNNITGNVTNPAGGYVNGAYVYATAPSSTTPVYGPVTTNSSGNYTLVIYSPGTYDIHIDPPSNTGYTPYTDSSVAVSSAQTINYQFAAQTNTLSGTLTDSSSNPLAGIAIKAVKSGTSTYYQTTTDSYGNYSLSVPAAYYYLILSGSMTGISSFTLSQQTSASLNLLSSSLTLNLTIHTATMTISAYNNYGQLVWGPNVSARSTSGVTSLYNGDPGTTISLVNSTGFSTSGSAGTITTIVGATYVASGLEASSYTTSVCVGISGSSLYDCLRLPLTITGDVSFSLPVASPTTRTFSGTLTDGSGNPVVGAGVTLVKYGDSSPTGSTDSSGNFSISAMPKKYYLKITWPSGVDGISTMTLTQSSATLPIDLTSGNVAQNLQANTANLTVSANDGSGNPNYSTSVNAITSAGTTTLYTGDPGESISITSTGFSTSGLSNVGTIGTIVGASYSAKGLNVTSQSGSICDGAGTVGHYNCLTTAYTVTGAASLNVPF